MQPSDTFPIEQYEVSLSRITGDGQILCDSVVDDRPMIITSNTSMEYSNLHEFSDYIVTVTALIANITAKATSNFTTLSNSKLTHNYYIYLLFLKQ